MIIFKVYLDTQEIKEKVNKYYTQNWDNQYLLETEYLLISCEPITNEEWQQWDSWLTENNIDYDFWKVI